MHFKWKNSPSGVNFKQRDSPSGVHFKRRDSPSGVHSKRRDSPSRVHFTRKDRPFIQPFPLSLCPLYLILGDIFTFFGRLCFWILNAIHTLLTLAFDLFIWEYLFACFEICKPTKQPAIKIYVDFQ